MRAVTTALAVCAGLLLAGCGGDDAAPVSKQDAADMAFADYVQDEGLADTDEETAILVDAAHSMCSAYDRGATFPEVIKAAMGSGYSANEAGQLNGAATAAYCPEHATS